MILNEINDGCGSNTRTATLSGGLTVDEIVEDLRLFPNSRHFKVHKSNLGSQYVAFRAPPEVITELALQDVVNAFRRVVLDPVRGLVMLMTPSGRHEGLKDEIDVAIKEVSTHLGINKITNLHSTRWKPKGGGKYTGDEPDNCYYVAKNVSNYNDACMEGSDEDFLDRNPPDLVVEVTISNFDKDKIAAYRALEVPEYWQIKGGSQARKADEVTFLDLQAQSTPVAVSTSSAIPGFTPDALMDCLKNSSIQFDTPQDYGIAIRQVLIDHGILPTDDNDDGGAPPPPPPP